MQDKWNAMYRTDIRIDPVESGPLSGKTFAVKDNFDVKGYVSAAGNPDWLNTHDEATKHAEVVASLVAFGATLVGKTHTDELMFSLNGENAHYGTPVNPKAEGRVPGGSSSGSAVAVAAGLTNFALGTDTGGSVRIPSSYCGIYGIRPTHGRISTAGVIKLAPSFCTVGWMAESAALLAQVGDVLFGTGNKDRRPFQRCVVATDVMHLIDSTLSSVFMNTVAKVHDHFASVRFASIAKETMTTWLWVFRILQGREVWQTHGDWITAVNPQFGPGIGERFAWTKTLTPDEERMARKIQMEIRNEMDTLLGEDTVLVMPTAPGIAPMRNLEAQALDSWRSRTLQLTCIAGLSGLPQVTMPVMEIDGMPVGFSFLAGRGQDERLLHFVEQLDWSEETINS